MDLMSNMGECQTKESPGWICENMKTISPEKFFQKGKDEKVSELLLSSKKGWRRIN